MAELELQAGQVTEATAHLRESLGLAPQSGNVHLIYCLDVSGYLCTQTGRWAEALSLWAARDACLHRTGQPDLPQDAARREEPIGRARRALGPQGARAAEDRGAAMTLATALDFAALLAAEDPRQPPPGPDQLPLSAREGNWSSWSPRDAPTPRSLPSSTSASAPSAATSTGSGTRPDAAAGPTSPGST
jgi:hypothetical protein